MSDDDESKMYAMKEEKNALQTHIVHLIPLIQLTLRRCSWPKNAASACSNDNIFFVTTGEEANMLPLTLFRWNYNHLNEKRELFCI